MRELYPFIELSMLTLYVIRLGWHKIILKNRLDRRFIEVYGFYVIMFFNALFFTLDLFNKNWIYSNYAFNFIHCSLPIVLPFTMLHGKFTVPFFLFVVLLVILNIYFNNFGFIVLTYLILIVWLGFRIYKFSLMSQVYRSKVFVYLAMILMLIITQIIYICSNAKVNWYQSSLVDYLLYVTQFTILFVNIIGHISLRRFVIQ
jgi:hypothetical protein